DRRSWAEGVVVGKIVERVQHPNADKLSICKVDVGQAELLNIVCGASNAKADILVPVATVGAYLSQIDLKIKPTKLRGERSEGMICSLTELGLEKNSDGIHIFADQSLVLGADVRPLFGLDDVILDISPTANRADALSMVGVAREVAALTGEALSLPDVPDLQIPTTELTVKISESKACPAYMGTVIEGVKIAASPLWLQQKLQAAGLRPINNLVDITNYVLLEWGQPLHAFDLEKLQTVAGGKSLTLGVRFAEESEKIQTLDAQERVLTTHNLLITANDKPVAIAGVMGGGNTEVDTTTKNIILESALFDGVVIRRSSKSQNLRSESSTRYERGVNFSALETARNRAIALILELTGGQVIGQAVADYRPDTSQKSIQLRLARVHSILGPIKTDEGQIAATDIERILTDLNCQLTTVSTNPQVWSVTVPSYRDRDIEREIDLIEEI
ncbi:MAG: phenylalanine--tRNA ligase subunit beta, partial [Microcystaceae cyanobacterium]